MAKKLSVDIVEQAALGKEVPPESDVIGEAFKNVCQAADALHERGDKRGALIVIGKYASTGEVPKARGDLRPNPFKGQYASIGDKFFQHMILQGAVGEGAVVADESGQILGGGIMLAVDDWRVAVPEGGFMRHTAAASTSKRKEVVATITLSEEHNVARVFTKGKVVECYDPSETDEEQPEGKAEADAPARATATAVQPSDVTRVVPPPARKKPKRTTGRKRKKKSEAVPRKKKSDATPRKKKSDRTPRKKAPKTAEVVAEPPPVVEDQMKLEAEPPLKDEADEGEES